MICSLLAINSVTTYGMYAGWSNYWKRGRTAYQQPVRRGYSNVPVRSGALTTQEYQTSAAQEEPTVFTEVSSGPLVRPTVSETPKQGWFSRWFGGAAPAPEPVEPVVGVRMRRPFTPKQELSDLEAQKRYQRTLGEDTSALSQKIREQELQVELQKARQGQQPVSQRGVPVLKAASDKLASDLARNRALIENAVENNPDFRYGQEYKDMMNEQRLTGLEKEIVDTRLEQAGLSSRNVAVVPVTAAGGGAQQAPMTTAWQRFRNSLLRPVPAPYMTRSTRRQQRESLAADVRDLSGQIGHARAIGDVLRVEELEGQRLVKEKELGVLREQELSSSSEQRLGVLSAWSPRSDRRNAALAKEKNELEQDLMNKKRILQEGTLNINNFYLTPEAKDLRSQITFDELDLAKINAELRE